MSNRKGNITTKKRERRQRGEMSKEKGEKIIKENVYKGDGRKGATKTGHGKKLRKNK